MIQAKCIQKFRDNTGKIYGYRLQDINGKTQDVQPDNLKNAIRNKQINVVNLTLTTDNRLVDTTEKQLQSKALGKAPVAPAKKTAIDSNKYSDVAKALVLLDKELLSMGDSYEEIVENRTYQACMNLSLYDLDKYYDDPEYADCNGDDGEILDKILYKAYLKMLNKYTEEIESIIRSWYEHDYYDIFEGNIQYENVSSINKSNIYKSLYLVYKYAKEVKLKKNIIEPLYNFLNRVKTTGVASINIGYNAGHNYYRYLDSSIFGTLSNDVYTVGHTITPSDIKEHKEYKGYSYVFHKDINRCGAPEISLAALFKNSDVDGVQVDIKIERHGYLTDTGRSVGITGYILDVESLIINSNSSVEEYSRIIANKFNELAPKLYDLADIHQSLYFNKKYNAPLEVVTIDDLNSHGRLDNKTLLNYAISRWTKIRGHRAPAKVDKILYNSDTSFKILYINNVSDNGNDARLYIEYNGSKFTLKVLNKGNINDVVIEEIAEMTGSVVDNSPLISEVITKALISANVRRI